MADVVTLMLAGFLVIMGWWLGWNFRTHYEVYKATKEDDE